MITLQIYRSPYGKTIYVAFIDNADCANRFYFDDNPCISKFWVKQTEAYFKNFHVKFSA